LLQSLGSNAPVISRVQKRVPNFKKLLILFFYQYVGYHNPSGCAMLPNRGVNLKRINFNT
jgi:hypothetical protein